MMDELIFAHKLDKIEGYTNKRQFSEALQEALKLPESSLDLENAKKVSLGMIYYYLENYDEAQSNLESVGECDDEIVRSIMHSYLGCIYLKKGLPETGLRLLELGIQEGRDDDATCFVSKGDCHFNLGQYTQALEAYRRAIGYNKYGDEYTLPEIEEKIKEVKQKIAEEDEYKERISAEIEAKKRPTHITIQGNNNPINLGGILATDDAVINRPTIQKEEEVITAFCPQCGCKVDADDRFCRKCGGKLR